MKGNIYKDLVADPRKELFENIIQSENIRVEKIISSGQSTPEGQWYDQATDEWVILLQGKAKLLFADGQEISLGEGDYLHIPAHKKHRVTYTQAQPPCIWLAVHWEEKSNA